MKNKVTKITKMDKKDSYGNTSFIVEFENGDKGFYNSQSENQTNFVVGIEAEYNIEKKIGKNNKEYFKVTLPQSGKSFGGGGRSYTPPDPKIQMISFAAAYTKDLIVGGKLPINEFEIFFNKIYTAMINKIALILFIVVLAACTSTEEDEARDAAPLFIKPAKGSVQHQIDSTANIQVI